MFGLNVLCCRFLRQRLLWGRVPGANEGGAGRGPGAAGGGEVTTDQRGA